MATVDIFVLAVARNQYGNQCGYSRMYYVLKDGVSMTVCVTYSNKPTPPPLSLPLMSVVYHTVEVSHRRHLKC